MNNLIALQKQMQNHLLSGDTIINESIVKTEKVTRERRLAIYREAYQIRLVDSLASNFPCLLIYIGRDAFNKIGLAYLDTFPSTYRSIRWFGDKLPNFLHDFYDEEHAYIAELAEFEWKLTLSFDANDTDILMIEQMAAVPPEAWAEVTFTAHPSLQRMNFFWNSVAIWQALSEEENPEPPIKNTSPAAWVLWRHDFINHFYELEQDEAWAMDALLAAANFGELCEGLCQWHNPDVVGMRAATLLKKWIQSGLLASLNYGVNHD